jgi:pyruvate dehydrogenase E2 component (dihydrolipoamide acetyltransferase)
MSKFEFKLPDIGEGVTEGEIVNWLVEVGDAVVEDQDIVEVMTDKATVTIGAPQAGTISELRGKPGDIVPVGGVLVVYELDAPGELPPPPVEPEPAEPAAAFEPTELEAEATAVGDIQEQLPGTTATAEVGRPDAYAPAASDQYFNARPLAAPATRRLARELGVDLTGVEPSGKGGRVTSDDVQRFVARHASEPEPVERAPAVSPAKQPRAAPAIAPAGVQQPPSDGGEERIPIRGVRRRIFENMARSKRTAAHLTYVDECEVSRLRELRERAQAVARDQGVRLTFLPFIIKATVAALKQHPALNALVDDEREEVVRKSTYDIGIATATKAGLMVPVLRQADRLSVLELAQELERLAGAAREGKTRPEDVGGSSFTITSLGRLGGLFAAPVLNYPEVGILGVHEMKQRPLVRGDQIVIGEVMLLSFSFDHRIIDGDVGAAFAQEIILNLQQPERLFVSMC